MTDALHDEPQLSVAGPALAANLALRLALELAALAALAYWGFHTGRSIAADVALGLGAPLVAAVVWGVFAAPNSVRRLHAGKLLAVQMAVLGAGAVALAAAGRPLLAAVFAAIVVVNAVLLHVMGGEPQP